ncbi:hypothetical protein HBJ58_18810 [Halomonas desiderata]|uniref:hypothetical protein n=1 Tax=Billgrantia desiderata TaxID=52021 RepID=UPI00174BABE7|nr:hypothetical protein [Halomonas desiderata]
MRKWIGITALVYLSGCASQAANNSDYLAFSTNHEQEETLMRSVHDEVGTDGEYTFSGLYRIQSMHGRGHWLCGQVKLPNEQGVYNVVRHRSGTVELAPEPQKLEACDLERYSAALGFRPSGERMFIGEQEKEPCSHMQAMEPHYPAGAITVRDIATLGCVAEERGEVHGIPYWINHASNAGRFYNAPARYGVGDDHYWVVNCSTDAINDARSCTIRRDGFFLFWQNGYGIMTTGTAYPGSNMHFRVDSNAALSAPESTGLTGAAANRLVQQMLAGNTLITRYSDWPYNTRNDVTIPTRGFAQALDYMQSIR